MKIGSHSSPAADAAALARSNAEAGAAASKARGAQQAESASSVQLSSTATSLRSDAAAPEFDAAKVERMKQAIANGSFAVNAEVIADKLIANAQELLGSIKSR